MTGTDFLLNILNAGTFRLCIFWEKLKLYDHHVFLVPFIPFMMWTNIADITFLSLEIYIPPEI